MATSTRLAKALVSGGCRIAEGNANAESAKVRKPLAGSFYVAVNGNDAWSGKLAEPTPDKTDGPFRTMEHARDEVRRLKIARTATGKNVTIVIRGGVSSGNWQVLTEENWITDRDPGFVNAAKGDFRLEPASEAFLKLPGFQPIPFEKIGLIKNVLRPTVQKEPWPDDLRKPQAGSGSKG